MQPFIKVTGLAAPLDRENVDTDAIIPKQFLKSVKRSGFGPNLFDEWRYLDHGEPEQDNIARPLNPDFVLNKPRYRGAQVLLTRANFGCGSSREHAAWALQDFGIRALVGVSFAEIFSNNCFKNGLLPVVLPAATIDSMFASAIATPGYELTVDLENQQVITPSNEVFDFSVDEFRKHCLLNGLDEIGLTLQHIEDIKNYEARRKQTAPWLFNQQRRNA